MTTDIVRHYFTLRKRLFDWPRTQSILNKFILSLAIAALTGILAQLRVYLPGTPVPITGQSFAVLISGVMLGTCWGGISQLFYVVLGIAGVPWFAGLNSGVGALFGPTGGYLIGFVVASLLVGKYIDTYPKARNFFPASAMMFFASVIIYVFGLTNLWLWFSLINKQSISFVQLLQMGMLPFIPGDLLKIALAAFVIKVLTPKES